MFKVSHSLNPLALYSLGQCLGPSYRYIWETETHQSPFLGVGVNAVALLLLSGAQMMKKICSFSPPLHYTAESVCCYGVALKKEPEAPEAL